MIEKQKVEALRGLSFVSGDVVPPTGTQGQEEYFQQ